MFKDQSQTVSESAHSPRSKKIIDVSSVLLLITGVISGAFAYHLTLTTDISALVLVPSVVAATTGALNLTTVISPR